MSGRKTGKYGVPLGRRPIYPFNELEHVGDSFLVVGGHKYRVQGAGNNHVSAHHDKGRKLAYYQNEDGILVILVGTSEGKARRTVVIDDNQGFLPVDQVVKVSGKRVPCTLVGRHTFVASDKLQRMSQAEVDELVEAENKAVEMPLEEVPF